MGIAVNAFARSTASCRVVGATGCRPKTAGRGDPSRLRTDTATAAINSYMCSLRGTGITSTLVMLGTVPGAWDQRAAVVAGLAGVFHAGVSPRLDGLSGICRLICRLVGCLLCKLAITCTRGRAYSWDTGALDGWTSTGLFHLIGSLAEAVFPRAMA